MFCPWVFYQEGTEPNNPSLESLCKVILILSWVSKFCVYLFVSLTWILPFPPDKKIRHLELLFPSPSFLAGPGYEHLYCKWRKKVKFHFSMTALAIAKWEFRIKHWSIPKTLHSLLVTALLMLIDQIKFSWIFLKENFIDNPLLFFVLMAKSPGRLLGLPDFLPTILRYNSEGCKSLEWWLFL